MNSNDGSIRNLQHASPDTIYVNARIWTEDPSQPEVEAIAVAGGTILAAGSDASVRRLAVPATRVIDLGGRRVVPGFNDAHVHMYIGGDSLASVNLRAVKNTDELHTTMGVYAKLRPAGEWIRNGNWDHQNWDPAELPTAAIIDDVTPEHPVFVQRTDGHMALANSLAMQLAGVTRETADVPGGLIVRDSEGNPTGIFKDAAKALIERFIPDPSEEYIELALIAAQQYAAENGVTSVQDMGMFGDRAAERMIPILRVYQRLDAAGRLTVRVSAHLPLPEWRRLGAAGIEAGFGSDKLKIGYVKSFSDGSLGSSTAWFCTPYTDLPETSGQPSEELVKQKDMFDNMVAADRAGLQIAVHAIGDRANNKVLDLMSELQAVNGTKDRRLRIEHAQHLQAADLSRFAAVDVVASMQPYHAIDDGRWAERRIGRERSAMAFAFRSLLDAGAKLAFGSDWWVAPISPILGIDAAVNRRLLGSGDVWMPHQRISVKEAVHAYTMGSAFAGREEHLKGSIEAGKLADFVALSKDLFAIDPLEIPSIEVDLTVCGGRVLYSRLGAAMADPQPHSPEASCL
jgi:predicted amidohydrolase YtcJ